MGNSVVEFEDSSPVTICPSITGVTDISIPINVTFTLRDGNATGNTIHYCWV